MRKIDRSRNQILEAAVDCLVEFGYHRMSLTRVAQVAEITRSGLQYHFPSLESLVLALCRHVLRHEWLAYESLSLAVPAERDPLDFAIDFVASPIVERYLIARLELVTAARTTPVLKAMLEVAAVEVDELGQHFVDGILCQTGLSATERYTAARDLSGLVNDWLFVRVFPPGQEIKRREAVLKALRISLYTLWQLPLPTYIGTDYLRSDGPLASETTP